MKYTVSSLCLYTLTKCTYSTSRKLLVDSGFLSAVPNVLTIVAGLLNVKWSKSVAQLLRMCEKMQKFLPHLPEVICISKEVTLDRSSVAHVTTRFLISCIFFNFCLVRNIAPSSLKSSGLLWFPHKITYIGICRSRDRDFVNFELLNKLTFKLQRTANEHAAKRWIYRGPHQQKIHWVDTLNSAKLIILGEICLSELIFT